MKCDIWTFFENLSRKFKLIWNAIRIIGTSDEYLFTFLVISHLILHRIRSSCRENKHTVIVFNNFFPKIVPVWVNVEKYSGTRQATDDNIIWCIHIVCWITKATDILRNTYLCSAATVVVQTHLNVTFVCILPVLFKTIMMGESC